MTVWPYLEFRWFTKQHRHVTFRTNENNKVFTKYSQIPVVYIFMLKKSFWIYCAGKVWTYQSVFVLKWCMLRGQSRSETCRGHGLVCPAASHEAFYCFDVASNYVIYNTEIASVWLGSCVCASCFNFSYVSSARGHMCSHALFGFLYKN